MSIGLEIAIEKCNESDREVEYRFLVREGRGGLAVPKPTARAGLVAIEKVTGQLELRMPCPDDAGGILYSRVVAVLTRHWKKGEYPETTWWAG